VFYYYGRKKQIARHYPKPQFDTIVEPFAGAASYAMHKENWKLRVVLIEKDPKVCDVWHWLIDEATEESIRKLPDLRTGEKSSEFLHIVHAATKMAFKYRTIKVTPVLERNWEISKRVMACSVHKVKHWELIEGDYRVSPDIEATWFIDPPYKHAPGDGYAFGSKQMDYEKLADWTMDRRGQLICCEGEFGDYLPFETLLELPGVAGKISQEKIYHRLCLSRAQKDLFGEPIIN